MIDMVGPAGPYMQTETPVTQIAFVVIGLAALLWGIRLYQLHRADRNPLAMMHVLLCFFGGSAVMLLGLPFIVSSDESILLICNHLAVVMFTGTMVMLARLMWFALFQTKFRFRYLAVPIGLIGLGALISDVLWLRIDINVYPAAPINAVSSLWLKSFLFATVMVPGGFFYIRQSRRAKTRLQQIRLAAVGLLFVNTALTSISENIISGGRGNAAEGTVRVVVGLIMLAAILLTLGRRKPQT